MRLLLVRHGQTQFNAEHRYLGAIDPELNANGIAQAKALCAVLPDSLDAVICSPLRRHKFRPPLCRLFHISHPQTALLGF